MAERDTFMVYMLWFWLLLVVFVLRVSGFVRVGRQEQWYHLSQSMSICV
jgi:hypothetical protein